MRRLCMLAFIVQFFSAAHAQTITYGAEGGLNLSGARATGQDGVVFHGTPGVRFSLGVFADIGLKDSIFSIQPKLFFSREAYTPNIFGDKTPFAISFITLPIPLVYHSNLAEKKLSFGLGPYLCYVVSGKYTYDGHTTKLALGNNSTYDDGKHFDAGIDAMVGYQLQDNLSLHARLDWGLTQDSADPSFDKVWTRNFSITCAYTLGQR